MPVFKCRMCGEVIDAEGVSPTVRCPHCGTVQAILMSADDVFVHGEKHVSEDTFPQTRKIMAIFAAVILAVMIAFLSWSGSFNFWSGNDGNMAQSQSTPGSIFDSVAKTSYYEEAAAGGDMEAQFVLGEMYYRGDGVDRDIHKAVELYKLAAEQGHAAAQARMGNAYYNGWGVDKDYKEALKWYRLAATQYNAEAQTAIGIMYYQGLGLVRSYTNAAWWYGQAAEQGYAWAQYYLGNMYRNGLGVDRDIEHARSLYQKAAEQGHLAAINALESIRKLK